LLLFFTGAAFLGAGFEAATFFAGTAFFGAGFAFFTGFAAFLGAGFFVAITVSPFLLR